MQLNDLIPIARLTGISEDSYLVFKPYKSFQDDFGKNEDFLKIKDLFLVFKDNRVRFVTLTDLKIDRSLFIRIKEIDILDEITNPDDVQLQIAPDGVAAVMEDEDSPVDKDAVFNDSVIGKITDWFNNSAHDVLIVELSDKTEIMIPDVDYYVLDETDEAIIFQNIEDFLKL